MLVKGSGRSPKHRTGIVPEGSAISVISMPIVLNHELWRDFESDIMGSCLCKLSLRARWEFEEISPQQISDEFDLVPRNKWAKGEQRITPKGTSLGGNRDCSYWSAPLNDCEIERLSEALAEAVNLLSKHEPFIQDFLQRGGRWDLFVGFFGEGTFGERLNAASLVGLGALGVDFSFEFYGSIQKETVAG